jgi:glycosyltransferase involved in cell wall biosynthesis
MKPNINSLNLSVIIITKNEEKAISDCLASITWANEIIVVDSGSTDNTVAICKSFGAKVFITDDWPGFGKQKNRALALASGDWVFSIDADESVSSALRNEIEAVINNLNKITAYQIPRKSSYCGQFINYSGWRPDYVTRLFRRNSGQFSDDLVHERVIVNDAVGTLNEPLLHISYINLEEVLDKVNRYSTSSAAMAYSRGKHASLTSAISHGLWAFVRTYLLRLGFLDGKMGFILAISNAETTYYRYLKLYFLRK